MAELMDSQLFKAAIVGDMCFLDESINVAKEKGQTLCDYWKQSTIQKNNVLHISASHNKTAEFISEAIKRFSLTSLVSEQNVDGNTTLHVAMLKGNAQVVEAILGAVSNTSTEEEIWSIQNEKGDTPLHIALGKPRNDDWLNFVLDKAYHPTTLLLNKSNESALHLYVRHFCHDIPQKEMKQEAMQEHIIALIRPNKSSACIKDMDGLTPLLLAAKNRCLSAVRIIVEECPESVEIRDPNERTFLHLIENVGYQQFKDLLDMNMIIALINTEDNQGNTSLHLAVQRRHLVALSALLECGADKTIKNKEGLSPSDIFESDTTFFGIVDTIYDSVEKGIMSNKLITAVEKGDVTLLNERGVKYKDTYFMSRTLGGCNIIHLAIQYDQQEWAKKALELYPQLIYQVDNQDIGDQHKVIKTMLAADGSIASTRDNEGFTPPLRAALSSRLAVCMLILQESPESIELRDLKGRTILHHFVHYDASIDIFGNGPPKPLHDIWDRVPGLDALRAAQDVDGNTPLHYVIKEGDITMAQFLVDRCVEAQVRLELSLIDNQGQLVLKLLALHPNSSAHVAMKERIEICMGKRAVMKDELYKTIVLHGGKLGSLLSQTKEDSDFTESDFLSSTTNGSNIVHLAIKHGHSEFVEKALESFPHLMLEVDSNGDNPLHTVAKFNNPASKKVLDRFAEFYANVPTTSFVISSPLLVRNSRGNTPLHEALRASNYDIARKILSYCLDDVAVMTNHAFETPIHMLARYGSQYICEAPEKAQSIMDALVKANKSVAYARDVDGFTLLLRAMQNGQFLLCATIMDQYPQSVELCDLEDRTILHHLVLFITSIDNNKSDAMNFLALILDHSEIRAQGAKQDKNGETPLHYAIKKGDLTLAKMLFEMRYETQNTEELYMVDDQGNSILSLLASHPDNFLPMSMKVKKPNCLLEMKLMNDKIYDAAVKRDLSTFINQCKDVNDLRCQTYEGSNILHLAIKANDVKGLKDALKIPNLPLFMTQRDRNGDIPVHIAAKFNNSASEMVLNCVRKWYQGAPRRNFRNSTTFLAQNSRGNTPLHEALAASNYKFAIQLIRDTVLVARVTNHIGETPLHIFARCGTNTGDSYKEIVEELIKADCDIAYKRDKDGLTPLLRAAESGRLWLCRTIITLCPLALEIRDPMGRSMLHHCVHYKSRVDDEVDNGLDTIVSLWDEAPGLDSLRVAQDKDGNTPLHYAIKENGISLAYILVERCVKAPAKHELFITDIAGNTVLHLLASHLTSSDHIEMLLDCDAEREDRELHWSKGIHDE